MNCTPVPDWNALARTPDGLSAHVVVATEETVASACGLESDQWDIIDQTDGPVRLCGTCTNHFSGTGPRPVALEDQSIPVDGVSVATIGTSATLSDSYRGGPA